MAQDFQVFISYARKDDINTGSDPTGSGFVSCLYDKLRKQLDDLGGSRVELWMDRDEIAETDPFAPILDRQIAASALMLVVMSPNWIQSPYCQREVASFAQRWGDEGEEAARTRFKVIRKRPNERPQWPAMLQGQTGLSFYSGEPSNANGLAHDFFWNGKVRDDSFNDRVRELAGIVIRDLSGRTGNEPPPPPPPPTTAPVQRTVYLARPARDMANAHARLMRELVGHDYVVVPDHDIPADEGGAAFVDEALAKASVSIHLLGFQQGYTPQDASPVVKLQLERAALRAGAAPLRRIVWAPKLLEKDPPDPTPVAERDPLAALEGFAPRLDSDKVDGQILSKFVDFLFQNLALSNSSPEPFVAPDDASELPKVYLCHDKGDEEFAGMLADALSERQVAPLLRSFDGEPDDVEALHHRRLQECDAVAVCWAQSPQAKIAMQTNEWKDWRQLQRSRRFAFKALVKGPPLDARKARSRFLFSHDEIDLQIELDADLKTCGDRIAQLVPRAGGVAP